MLPSLRQRHARRRRRTRRDRDVDVRRATVQRVLELGHRDVVGGRQVQRLRRREAPVAVAGRRRRERPGRQDRRGRVLAEADGTAIKAATTGRRHRGSSKHPLSPLGPDVIRPARQLNQRPTAAVNLSGGDTARGSAPQARGTARSIPRTGSTSPCVRTHAATASCTSPHKPPATPPSKRRAVRRALLDREPLQRHLEHGRDDLQPQLAARAAARHAAALAAADEVERVAQAARDALEHGAHERAAVVADLEAGERAARVGVGVRRPLAGQVREERQALDARLPRSPPPRPAPRTRRRRRPAATPASRPPTASRPSGARRPAPRGRTRARAPAGPRGIPAAPRTRRRTCPSPLRAAPAGPRPRRARRPPGRRRPPRPATPAGVRPDTSGDSSTLGSHARSISSASSTSSLQRRRATSSSSVPEASATSIARSPVSFSRT